MNETFETMVEAIGVAGPLVSVTTEAVQGKRLADVSVGELLALMASQQCAMSKFRIEEDRGYIDGFRSNTDADSWI